MTNDDLTTPRTKTTRVYGDASIMVIQCAVHHDNHDEVKYSIFRRHGVQVTVIESEDETA